MHGAKLKIAAGAAAVLTLLALTATSATARPPAAAAPVSTSTSQVSSTSIIDPVTGQELMVAYVQETTVATAAEPGIKCTSKASYYIIYFPLPYVELLRWKFNHQWCWELHLVTSVKITDALQFKNTTIKMAGGEWKQTVNPGPPRNTVHTELKGMNFQYCPLIGPGVVSCIANFDPVIRVYLSWGGVYTDQTTL